MKKKVLSFILALSMILGSMGMTFAAPAVFEDVEDADVAKAVERLQAFNIVDGYEDGTYRPGQDVTREEFAKLLVTALGIDHAASAVTTADYKDVEAGRWSAGYIAVASGQGLIIGDPDGNFRPADKVSYAESVTMLVRAVGYQDSFLKGTWPGNFVAKAAELSITSKVRFADAAGYANRGEVAVLLNNTLDTDVVKVETYEGDVIKYRETKTPLLQDKLEIEKLEDIRLVTNSRLDSGLRDLEARVITTKKDVEYDGKEYDRYDSIVFDISKDFDTEKFLGKEITAYVNDDDVIVYAEIETTDGNIYERDRIDYKFNNGYEEQLVTINGKGKKVDVYSKDGKINEDRNVDDYQYIYVDGERVSNDIDSLEDGLGFLAYGTFILDNNKLVFADLVTWTDLNYVVESVDASKDRITYINTKTATDDRKLDLANKYDGYSIFLSDGTQIELEDLRENDVFNLAESKDNDDDVAVIYVWRDSVEGKFGDVSGGTGETTPGANNGRRISMRIGDKNYPAETDLTYTVDSGEDYEWIGGQSADGREELEDFGAEIALGLRNWKGRIVFLTGDAKATSKDQYGVIMKLGTGIRNEVKLYTSNDEEVVYEFEESKDYTWLASNANEGDVLRYQLTKGGEIAEFDRDTDKTVFGKYVFSLEKDIGIIKQGDDLGKTSVKVGDRTYYVQDSTAFFDMTESMARKDKDDVDQGFKVDDIDELDIFQWKDIEDKDVTQDVYVLFGENAKARDRDNSRYTGDLDFLAVIDGLQDIKDDIAGSYFVDAYTRGDTNYAKVATFDEGESEYELDGAIDRYYLKGRVYPTETASNNKIRLSTHRDFETVTGKVTDIDRSRIEIGGKRYGVDRDAVIYDGNKSIDLSSIKEDDFVAAILNKGEVEALSLVYSAGSADRLGEGVIAKNGTIQIKDGDTYRAYWGTVDMVTNDGYLSDTTYNGTSKLKAGDEVEFIYIRDTKEVKALWVKDYKELDEDEDEDKDGPEVTYINAAEGLIEVDGKVLKLDATVRLADADGKTLAIGPIAVANKLSVDDKVVITEKDGVVTGIKLVADKEDPVDPEEPEVPEEPETEVKWETKPGYSFGYIEGKVSTTENVEVKAYDGDDELDVELNEDGNFNVDVTAVGIFTEVKVTVEQDGKVILEEDVLKTL